MTASSPTRRERRCWSRFPPCCGIRSPSLHSSEGPMLALFETREDTARADVAEDRLEVLGRSLFQPTGSSGVHARTALFETVIEALSALITQHREVDTEVLR